MALTTPYVEVDSESTMIGLVDSDFITIEGADALAHKLTNRATRVEDYLGIGNPLIYR